MSLEVVEAAEPVSGSAAHHAGRASCEQLSVIVLACALECPTFVVLHLIIFSLVALFLLVFSVDPARVNAIEDLIFSTALVADHKRLVLGIAVLTIVVIIVMVFLLHLVSILFYVMLLVDLFVRLPASGADDGVHDPMAARTAATGSGYYATLLIVLLEIALIIFASDAAFTEDHLVVSGSRAAYSCHDIRSRRLISTVDAASSHVLVVEHPLVVIVLFETSSGLIGLSYHKRGLVLVLLSLQIGRASTTQWPTSPHGASTTIVLLEELSRWSLASYASSEVQSGRRVSLIGAATRYCAELLDLKVLESNVLLLKLKVLALYPLQVPSPSL